MFPKSSMRSAEVQGIMIMPQVSSLTNTESYMDTSARIGNRSKLSITYICTKGYLQKTDMYGNRESKSWPRQHMAGMIVTYVIPMSENSRLGGKVKNTTI